MNVRFPAKSGKICRLVVVALAVVAGTSACGQIGPLYLPDQNDAETEQGEAQAQDTDSDENKVREENDGKNPGGL